MMTETRDCTRALEQLLRLRGGTPPDPTRTVVFVHTGVPQPKARARWSPLNKRFYTPDVSASAETALAWEFKSALGRRPPLVDTVAIVAVFYLPTRQRKDTDNLLKLVMDAGTKARVWKDDSQVVAAASFMVLDPDAPRTVVALAPCAPLASSFV